jgi:hypothetical protein
MSTMRQLCLFVFISSTFGCNREDPDKLTKIGWIVVDKVQALVPEQTPFGGSWNSFGGLETRVRSRLQSDKFLAPLGIQVQAEGNQIRIRGTVNDPILKRRAIEMIEATVGVEGIIDELELTN